MARRSPVADRALSTLLAEARERGHHALLQMPLVAVALRAWRYSPRTAMWLANMGTGSARSVSLDDVERHFDGAPPQLSAQTLTRAFRGLLSEAPVSSASCEGEDAAGIVAFAKRHDLEHILEAQPLRYLSQVMGPLPARNNLQQFRRMRDLVEYPPLRELVATALDVEADIAAAAREGRDAFVVVCEGEWATPRRAYVERAVALSATFVPELWPPFPLDRPPYLRWATRALYSESATGFGDNVIVDTSTLRVLEGAKQPTARALLRLAAIVNEPEPFEDTVMRELFAPRHEELLAALAELAPGAAREERVVWVLTDDEDGTFRAEPMAQRALQKGGFSKGTRVSASAVARGKHGATKQDQLIASALSASPTLHASPVALRALIDHPLVTDTKREPIRVRQGHAKARLVDVDGGYRLGVEIDGVPFEPAGVDGSVPTTVALSLPGGVVAVAEVSPALQRLAMVAQRAAFIPSDAAPALHDVLERLGEDAPLSLSTSLQGDALPADARVVLRFAPEGEGLRLRVGFRPLPGGVLYAPADGPVEPAGLVDGKRHRARREFPHERARALAVREQLPLSSLHDLVIDDEWSYAAPSPDAALSLLEAAQALPQQHDDVVLEWKDQKAAMQVVQSATAKGLKLRVKSIHEWLAVEGEIELDGELVTLGALLEAVRQGRKYVALSAGRYAKLSAELRARAQPLAAFSDGSGDDGVTVAPSMAQALDDLQREGAQFDDTAVWRDVQTRMQAAREASDEPPRGLRAELRPYQRAGLRFLRRLQAWQTGGVLADDMGLGKTLQTIAALLERQNRGPQLVLAPTSVCFNWGRELERFAPGLTVHQLQASMPEIERKALLEGLGNSDVVVAGYAIAVLCAEALGAVHFASVVLDEAQAIKNPDTQRAKLCRDLQADWKLALSGTPIENHLGELWSVFRVVSPGLLGSQESFRARYALPIERDKSLQKRKELAAALRPFLLRRTKDEVLPELPQRTEIVVPVELSTDERARYDATRAAILADVMAGEAGVADDRRFRVLAGLTKLRLLACHPRLVDPEAPSPSSSKLDAIVRTVQDLKENGHRALVFSQFVKHLEMVRPALSAAGVASLMLDGSTPQKERMRLVDAFQAGEADVFLLSLKAGGAGLNLTAADYVLHLDPWWNPAVEDQATGRAHRIGQTRPVTVYRFVARGTLEEQMLALHQDKRDLVDGVLEGADAAGRLGIDDLVAFLRPGNG